MGRLAGVRRDDPARDRGDDLRRRRRGGARDPDQPTSSARSTTPGSPRRAALRLDHSAFLRARRWRSSSASSGPGSTACTPSASSSRTRRLGELFGHAFISIALAYVVAHYFSAVVDQEQAQFGFLLSDPLGDGSDYFGTADNGINYGAISATAVWYIQVAALVIGHVIALVLGHDRALKVYGDTRTAARSQYWMLALMVGFTSLGLYLLSQSNA